MTLTATVPFDADTLMQLPEGFRMVEQWSTQIMVNGEVVTTITGTENTSTRESHNGYVLHCVGTERHYRPNADVTTRELPTTHILAATPEYFRSVCQEANNNKRRA